MRLWVGFIGIVIALAILWWVIANERK